MMVANAVVPVAEAYQDAFPGTSPGPGTPLKMWDAIRYTAEEQFEEDRLAVSSPCSVITCRDPWRSRSAHEAAGHSA